jgi:HSP20 family protein
LLRQSPQTLNRLREEFDALFDQFFGRWPASFFGAGEQPNWGLDLEDTDNQVVVRAEAPGFEAGDFDIQVSGDVLTIRAERKQESKGKQDDFQYTERRLNRTVTLPPGVQADNVEAH